MVKPANGQSDWGTALNAHLDTIASDIAAKASTASVAAKQDAATLPADIATVDANAASAFRVAQDARLSATIAAAAPPLKSGPRSIPRVKQGLRPILGIDEQYPKPEAGLTHKILYGGTGRRYAWGHDSTLRFSTDDGRTWQRIYNGPNNGIMGRDGLFIKVTGGGFAADQCLVASWHPFDGSAPELKRSIDYGSTWTTVQGPTTDVKYLGPASVVQSPTTGSLYAAEYVTATPAAKPTTRIMKSTDQGATWTVWKTLSRAYDTDPEVGVMHPHSIQVDPFTDRLWVLIGDAAKSAGLYRLLADESDWEAICTNRMSGAMPTSGPGNGAWCGAVGLMFFPNYISWGVDQSFTGNLLRLARTQFGQAFPAVEVVGALNSTAFYAARATTDHTEWVLSASQEGGPGSSRLDNAVHLYRVADDAATVDELGSIPVHADTSAFSWAFPIGTPLGDLEDGLMWWGTNVADGPNQGDPYINGTQFAARLAWSNSLIQKPSTSKVHEHPITQCSQVFTAVGAGGYRDFAVTIAPSRATVLYIIEAGVKSWNGAGAIGQKANTVPRVQIWRTSPFALAKLDGGAVDAEFASSSRKVSVQGMSDAYVHRITGIAAGEEIHFRLANLATATATADLSGFVAYAWGY